MCKTLFFYASDIPYSVITHPLSDKDKPKLKIKLFRAAALPPTRSHPLHASKEERNDWWRRDGKRQASELKTSETNDGHRGTTRTQNNKNHTRKAKPREKKQRKWSTVPAFQALRNVTLGTREDPTRDFGAWLSHLDRHGAMSLSGQFLLISIACVTAKYLVFSWVICVCFSCQLLCGVLWFLVGGLSVACFHDELHLWNFYSTTLPRGTECVATWLSLFSCENRICKREVIIEWKINMYGLEEGTPRVTSSLGIWYIFGFEHRILNSKLHRGCSDQENVT